jgi:Transcriptional regulator, AbiEi antitoxin, Type IV TA system
MGYKVNIRNDPRINTLATAFKGTPFKIRPANDSADISTDGFSIKMRLYSAGDGWPSDVRRVLSGATASWPRNAIIIARHFAPGSIKLLRANNANWADAAGNARIFVPPSLLIDRTAPAVLPAKVLFSWNPSSVDIAEFLLTRRPARIRVVDIVRETNWSAARVTAVLTGLDEKGWTKRHGALRGRSVWRELINPGSLLEAWSAGVASKKPRARLAHGLMRNPKAYAIEQIAPRLGSKLQWGATTWLAASRLAPYSTVIPSLHLYVPHDLIDEESFGSTIETMGLREVESGANVEFRGADPRLFKYLQHRDIPLVGSPRVYADLMALGGRAEDAANHLRETVLGY